MAFYAGKIVQHPAMDNPTLVVLTDRNDLDDQLFNTSSLCSDLLRQTPTQAENRENLQELLQVASGGIVFTTIQKFAPDTGIEYPKLSDRRNIILIADEAHRSQYGLKAKVTIKSNKNNVYSFPSPQKPTLKAAETSKSTYKITPIENIQEITETRISYGFAKYLRDALPSASFIGFTGTPIESSDVNTPAVFGNYIKAVIELSKAFALVSSTDEAIALRDEVGFFQVIKAAMVKHTTVNGKSPDDLDAAVRQIVSKAVASDQVIDIFAAAGLKNPNIAILSDDFLEEVRGLPYKNVALEVLKKLISDDIKIRSRKNLIQSRSFREMLENTIKRYQNRSLETAQVINELIALAKEMREAQKRGEDLGLTEDEIAFYDALEVNDSAVEVLGDDLSK